jgi:hypothetical protein
MDQQTTFRLPRELSRTLTRVAKERGVPKSHIVREALERYFYPEPGRARGATVRERSAPFIGSLQLQQPAPGADDLSALIRARNWRE